MYKPIQPYHMLNKVLQEKIYYKETVIPELSDVLVYMWELGYKEGITGTAVDIEIPDVCAEFVVSVVGKQIVWGYFSKSEFNMEFPLGEYYIGMKFRPGVFTALTGVDKNVIKDIMTPIEQIDPSFDKEHFFTLEYEEMKDYLVSYFVKLAKQIKSRKYIDLFNDIYYDNIQTIDELYDYMELTPRQVQRLFHKHYGFTPQATLAIMKFTHCVRQLLYKESEKDELVDFYYDQSKFINEFKKHLGITPVQFVKLRDEVDALENKHQKADL